jgi:hypothetical protein
MTRLITHCSAIIIQLAGLSYPDTVDGAPLDY